jgi:hypothetical protein
MFDLSAQNAVFDCICTPSEWGIYGEQKEREISVWPTRVQGPVVIGFLPSDDCLGLSRIVGEEE